MCVYETYVQSRLSTRYLWVIQRTGASPLNYRQPTGVVVILPARTARLLVAVVSKIATACVGGNATLASKNSKITTAVGSHLFEMQNCAAVGIPEVCDSKLVF